MDTIRRFVGMVIPVWFPPSLADAQVRDSLLDTLHDCEHYVAWEHVVLVVDGDARSYAIVQDLQAACRQHHGRAFEVLYSPENGGKGAAICRGTQWFLERTGLEYLATRDADGDHAVNDLMNLMHLGLALRLNDGAEAVIVVGRRNQPHRALGWVRGELETLLNRVLIDAVRFSLAQRQQVLNTRYFSLSGEYPDLHSGYKVYSRRVCELLVERSWERPPWVGPEIYRYGVEAVPFAEGVLAGATIGEIPRLTREPEFTGHGAFARSEANACVLLWTFLRMGIGALHATALMDNHLSRLTLWTDPEGRALLLDLRQSVVDRLCQAVDEPSQPSESRAGSFF
jgi:hypothetical protein